VGERYVIIGNGAASAECVKAVREGGFKGELVVISDVDSPHFNPTLITYYASGEIGYEELFPYGASFDFYEKYNVDRRFGTPVASLDAENRVVTDADGNQISFDKCMITSGANPVLPQAFQGVKNGIVTLRTIEDAKRFKKLLDSDRKRALVIGASMIGVKVVEDFVKAGFSVTLADFAKYIFPLAAHENCSKLIHKILEGQNVKLLFESPVKKAEKYNDGFRVFFEGGLEPVLYDHLVLCAGTAPNISFINPEQIKTARGVLVNEYMETSAEGIYAAGDVAQAPSLPAGEQNVIGLWSNARAQGRTAGMNAAGKRAKYHGVILHNMTHFFGHDFVGVGDVINGDYVYEKADEEKSRYLRLVFKDRELIGVNLLNIPEISGTLKHHLTKGIFSAGPMNKYVNESLALNRLYEKYPDIEKTFAEMR